VIDSVPFRIAGQLTMSAGVGLTEAPGDGDTLYRLADRALYEAKQQGRNRTACRIAGSLTRPFSVALPHPADALKDAEQAATDESEDQPAIRSSMAW
jgi:predicted signal transduction protein with EAL and GGDEF domain